MINNTKSTAPRRFGSSFIKLVRQASSKSLGRGGGSKHRRQSIIDNDDASVCSTLTVDRAPHGKLPTSASDDSTDTTSATMATTVVVEIKKEVRFNLDDNVVHASADVVEDEEQDDEMIDDARWYSLEDFDRFKEYSSTFGKRVAAGERGNTSPCTYTAILTRTYLACCQAQEDDVSSVLDEVESKLLRQWVQATLCRHGVERNCVKYLRKQRRNTRQEIVRTVVELQQQQKQEGTTEEDIGSEEMIRQACETVSRSSRLFARTMAEVSVESSPAAVAASEA